MSEFFTLFGDRLRNGDRVSATVLATPKGH